MSSRHTAVEYVLYLVANFLLTDLFLLSGNADEVEAGPGSRVVRLVGAELGAALAEDGEAVISDGDVLLDDLLATEARPAVCVEEAASSRCY